MNKNAKLYSVSIGKDVYAECFFILMTIVLFVNDYLYVIFKPSRLYWVIAFSYSIYVFIKDKEKKSLLWIIEEEVDN